MKNKEQNPGTKANNRTADEQAANSVVENAPEASFNYMILNSIQGPKGDNGANGKDGAKGDKGDQGIPGIVPKDLIVLANTPVPPAGFADTGLMLNPSGIKRNFSYRTAMPQGRMWAAAFTAYNKIYVLGGNKNGTIIDEFSDRVQVYDAINNTWGDMASLPGARYGATAVPQFYSAMYIFGGTTNGTDYLRDNYGNLIDTGGPWVDMQAPMPFGTVGALGVVKGVNVLLLGGTATGSNAVLQVYNAFARTWTTKETTMPQFSGGGAVLIDSNIYIFGGSTQKFAPSQEPAIYGVYNIDNNTFTAIPPPTNPGFFFPGVTLLDDAIYVAGGIAYNGEVCAMVYIFDYKNNRWHDKSIPLDSAVSCPLALTANNNIYMIGGTQSLAGPAVNYAQASDSVVLYLLQKL